MLAPPARQRTNDPGDDPDATDDDGSDAANGEDDGREHAADDDPTADEQTSTGDGEADHPDEAEPQPIRHRAGPGSRGSGGRGPGGPARPGGGDAGGPRDGAPRLRDRLRGIGLAVVIFAILATITLAGVLLDLVTDAIWYRSVGYDAVFFTRLGTQAVLFVGVFVAVLLFLGLNLALAGRLAPPPDPERVGTVGGLAARLGEAFGVEAARAGRGPGGRSSFGGAGFGGGGQVRTISFEPEDMPDLVPIARWGIVALAVIIALATAASAAGQWETVLLWRNQVPFAASGPAVVDPIFGRDVSYYLFELPFLRAGQALVNGLLIAALGLSIGRYLLAGVRGGLAFTTQMRLHLAILGGLYLLSVAVGYQLDKLELVYSTQGVATGVSFTDQSARFLAFDVLTAISAFAGAFLIIGAFTRAMWPLGAVIIVWLSASLVLGTVYPGLVQRVQVDPDQLGRETPFIANNIRMTRIAFDVADWERRDYSGEAPLTPDAIDKENATFQNARLWDYRPLRDTLDQLQTVRQYYDFTDVDTDRYRLSNIPRQVMLSARELAPEKNTQGGTWVNQRITFTHGIGVAMVPVNAATEGGQPELIIRDMPPASSGGAPPIAQPRIYFGERPSDWIVTGARQSEFDYPVSSTATGGSAAADQTTRWTGTSGVRLDTTLSRVLFALRFRDLNLLISDQVTADSQLLFHRSLADRLSRIAPFLRFDKDPYLVVTDDGRLVYIQDAYTTSDRFPNAQWFDPTTLGATNLGTDPFNYIRNSVKIVEDAYTGEMTFYVSDPERPDHPDLRAHLPDPVQAARGDPRRPPLAPPRARGDVQRPDPDLRPLPRPGPRGVLQQRGPVDRAVANE